ncbi:S-layer homology domain-containing protein [Bacillus dakarensis]|uniref:S-layer homology domain-containing protein n=1 Tax=Robertmurraya dakarensis TaxID=1926278 RepID=UPI0009825D12|nr:S-layer homology domain-containing protein [Bacillus dakarensis]
MKKSFIIPTLLFSTLFFHGSNTEAATFTDVSTNIEEIDYLTEQGMINGYENGTFRPYESLKRLQAVQMLMRDPSLNKPDIVPPDPGFTDVKPGDYGYEEIAMAVHLGIISGKEDPTTNERYFDPWGKLTRAQMSKILTKTYHLSGQYDSEFRDVGSSYWAYDEINSLAASNIAVGYPNNEYKPNEPLTRNHFALFLSRTKEERFRPDFKEITFNEPLIEKAIRNQLAKPTGKITSYNMGAITHLDLVDKSNRQIQIDDFTGLEYAVNLKSFRVALSWNSEPANLEFLKSLPRLESLSLYNLENENLEPLRTLEKLKHLTLQAGNVDLNQLKELSNLESLSVSIPMKNADFLLPLKNLKSIELANYQNYDQKLDLGMFKGFPNLTSLKISNTTAENAEELAALKLTTLKLVDVYVHNYDWVSKLKTMEYLELKGAFLTSESLEEIIFPLPNLKEVRLTVIGLNGTGGLDEEFLGMYSTFISELESRGVNVYFSFPIEL